MNTTANQSQGSSMLPNMTHHGTFQVPRNIQIGVTILAVIVFILGMIGNTLVIYIVFTVNHMHSSINILIANMAFADLLMTIDLAYILKWFYVFNKWFGTFMGTVLCKFLHSLQIGSLAASVFSLVVISLDRSFAILFPMKKLMTPNVVRLAIIMTWLGALALMLPIMIATKNKQWEGGDGMICDEFWKPMSEKVYVTVVFVIAYIVPLIITALVYCLAGLRLYRRTLPGHQNPTAHKQVQASSRRATAMLITVTIILALSWLPLQALEMIKVYKPSLRLEIPIEVEVIVPMLGYSNSAINPVLYVIFSGNYRREFYRILCRGASSRDSKRVPVVNKCTTRQTGHRVQEEASDFECETRL